MVRFEMKKQCKSAFVYHPVISCREVEFFYKYISAWDTKPEICGERWLVD